MTDYTPSSPEQRLRFIQILGETEKVLASVPAGDFNPNVIAFMQDLPLDAFECLFDLATGGGWDRVATHLEFADLHRDDS